VSPITSPQTQQALRQIAASDPRVFLEEVPAGKTRWPQLLDMSDLVLCAYQPDAHLAYSAVLAEALANGIPAIVPARTFLAGMLIECGEPGATFDRFEPASIAAATGRVLDRFDEFATRAYLAAQKWSERLGPARLVDELMRV